MIALILLAWLAIQTTPVQNWLVRQITGRLSKDLQTTVRIKHVDFALFNKMLLEGTLVEDRQKDTLLYAGTLKVNITDWFFFKDNIELKYIGLDDAVIRLKRTDSVWNYRFLADYFGRGKSSGKKSSIQLNLKTVEFKNVQLMQQDGWRGEDLVLQLGKLDIDADQLNLQKKQVRINTIAIDKPSFTVYNYEGNRPDSLRPKTIHIPIVNDPKNLRWNPGEWEIRVGEITMQDGIFRNEVQMTRQPYSTFDGNHIEFSKIKGNFKNVLFNRDTITAAVVLSTQERSGLQVKKLQANFKMHPEAMEFGNLDLITNRSHLKHFFAMRYETFDDMSDFESKVRMEADLADAELNSDDIAYFAPELADWKKQIRINGKIKGSVENLSARNLVIEAGKDTYLNGNISLRGLPDMNKTFIDFVANDFRTTYPDAIRIIPELKNITQVHLEELKYIQFRGNLTGFIKNFVTYGTIKTNLGTIVSDLNMRFPDNAPTGYAGNIKTEGFDLGRFTGSPQLGIINFQGKINGKGLKANTLNARLDGTIHSLQVKGYTYQDIIVKGTVTKRLFNGELVVNDPHLQVSMNGLVNLDKEIPEFNFDADFTKAELHSINLLKDSVDFTGKVKVNFTGDHIDNFLGVARIYDATIMKKGKRISFDSLSLESKTMGNNKVITAVSNEFDAALVGEFSIKDMPAAFSTFLNKYYPSYIKPAKEIPRDENFSFVITTKKVEEYLDFFDKNLSGFNYSTITGRINSNENLLDLNAEIPQFGYKNVLLYNFNLKGTGNLDSLTMENSIADVYINDSLHFPGSSINIRSSNDMSQVSIRTSASQAINAADLSARVQTMRNGVRIIFDESHFDLNGKTWTIDKDGEMVLSKELVSADGLKIYNGQQEILVTTQPSDIGNTNDIKIELLKLNIGDFVPYVVKSNRLEGLLNASIDIVDPFGKMQVDMSGEAEMFRLDNDSIGTLQLNSNYNQHTGEIHFATVSQNKNYDFDLKGQYNLPDSNSNNEYLDIVTNFRNTRINLLEQYLNTVFTDVGGNATGQLEIQGPPDDLKYLGRVSLQDGTLRVKYTNVLYKIPSATFNFRDTAIDFGSFTIKDEFGNAGQLTKGVLKHRDFDNLDFDFALNTNKMLVLATTGTSGDIYYGNVFAKANVTFRGPLEDMRLNIRGEPADSSKLFIRPSAGRESGQADFIEWKVYGREMTHVRSSKESNLNVALDIHANNYANVYVILDELTGDIIQANGTGNLKMRASTDGEFTITGRYDIERGKYNFTFQSLFRKPFTLREDAGNYIQWTGDPYDADVHISAEYLAENVRFSDLGLDQFSIQSGAASSGVNNNVRKYRGEVVVIAKLTDKLLKPTINFEIELPPNSSLKNDPDAQAILQRIESDVNELNKQVAFLIVFNSFGPLSSSTNQGGLANIAFEGVVVNSISGILSNTLSQQFSGIFQKIFNDRSIKVTINAQLYNGSNIVDNLNSNRLNIDRSNVNFNFGKSFLNERLTFTFGSALDFGLSSEQVQATKNLQFLPDITAEWKIRQDGRLVLTFFYRDSYNYLSGTGARQNRSGTAISYRREFDRISDLWRGNRNKKKKAPEKPDSTTSKVPVPDTVNSEQNDN